MFRLAIVPGSARRLPSVGAATVMAGSRAPACLITGSSPVVWKSADGGHNAPEAPLAATTATATVINAARINGTRRANYSSDVDGGDGPVRSTKGFNIFKGGADPVLGADEDYPDWLRDLVEQNAQGGPELTPDDAAYYRARRKVGIKASNEDSAK